ncbi:MAG TPA: methionine--tRNA ligase, partial [bacterium (Candidatus Stahlbacteria)]|nr:methionine--tRNA ligase [Candidatus Stahlbacteria bacterium]
HLAGAYLPADIYVRFKRLQGADIIHICGTDEHGVPITITAEKEKKTPKEIVDHYYQRIKDSFERFGITFDNFSRTSIPLHHKVSQDFFLKVKEKEYIYPKDVQQLFCPKCQRFLPDRYIAGTCPHCGFEEARGDQCEKCGRWLESTTLKNPRCKICGGTPEIRSSRHWFFKLSGFQDKLKDWIKSKKGWKENVRNFCEGWFKEGLDDRSITRDLKWGVEVPLEEAKGKVMYVWFDAPIGYISSTIEWAERIGKPDLWKDYWFDKETRLIHFIGKDNIVFHALVWPAMLMAHGDYVLPSDIPANEFLNLEGRPMSTSRGWAVWLPEYLEDFEPDPLRYAIAINAPQSRDADFSWRDYRRRNNDELADVLGNFVNRTLKFIENNYNRGVPVASLIDDASKQVLAEITKTAEKVENLLEHFDVKQALREAMGLAQNGNQYFDHQKPWSTRKSNPLSCEQTIHVCTRIISGLSIMLEPFLPFTCSKIRKMLNTGDPKWSDLKDPPISESIGEISPLFSKIETETAELQLDKIKKRAETARRQEIDIEQFQSVEIRIGRILSAQLVPKSKNLIQMEVSFGEFARSVVAGIGEHYKPEDLVGKKAAFVTNLRPAKIKGIVSEAMILAADWEDGIKIIIPDGDPPEGSKIR